MRPNAQVSVVIPARNAGETIEEALASICKCHGITQIIVVNDGSTDDTLEKVRAVDDPRIEIIDGPGTGISDALNTGFGAVVTPYVMRCDADDTIPADRLEWQIPILEDDPGLVAVSGGFESVLDDGTPCGVLACGGEARDVTLPLRAGQTVTGLWTWLIRSDAIRATGGARSWFRTGEDIDLQLRLAARGRVLHVPRVAYFYRLHDCSIVHSTSDSSRAFFDSHAAAFISDRMKTGSDALERGEPLPAPPQPGKGVFRSALDQGIGHAIATAWDEADRRECLAALKRLSRLLPKAPANRKLWANLLKVSLRWACAPFGRNRKARG